MSDTGSVLSRRSSSQTSHASSDGRRTKTIRGNPHRTGSRTSTTSQLEDDPSLTSFPSLEPDTEPPNSSQDAAVAPPVKRTTSQKARDRKATLARLTSASSAVGTGNALFDDSPRSSFDVPGSLHLSNDEHIKRLIAKTGAVKLLRQYAQDLAQRDAEISALRVRADNRERELKRLLREADVPTAEIERRLLRLEQGDVSDGKGTTSRVSIDGLMGDAIGSELGLSSPTQLNEIGLPIPTIQQAPTARKASLKASATSSRQSSRTSSLLSEASQDPDQTVRPRASGSNPNRGSGLQSIFQPPAQSSYFIGGNKSLRKPKAADEVSIKST